MPGKRTRPEPAPPKQPPHPLCAKHGHCDVPMQAMSGSARCLRCGTHLGRLYARE